MLTWKFMISSGAKGEYVVKVAETVEEAIKLIEVGFEW
jgi:hypothetical protein